MNDRNRDYRPKSPKPAAPGPRRHEERAQIKKKPKYREDPLLDEDLVEGDLDDNDGGVLSDFEDDELDEDNEPGEPAER